MYCFFSSCQNDESQFVFAVIGDVPYNKKEEIDLGNLITKNNETPKSNFIIHVGDIKPGPTPCDESVYLNVSNILKKSKVPVYIVPGDNEFNDCDDPIQGMKFWNQYFLHFHKNWELSHEIEYQGEQIENFAWRREKILFIGINLVGGKYHDSLEWKKRLSNNEAWIHKQISNRKDSVNALVLIGHANLDINPNRFEEFVSGFRSAARMFKKPILFLHGDGHAWIQDRPWPEQNIQRIQVEAGASRLLIKINSNLKNPFKILRG